MIFGIVELYHGQSGKKGFYNSQEIGLARAMKKLGHTCVIFYPRTGIPSAEEDLVEDGITIVYVPARAIGVHAWYDWRILKEYHVEAAQIGSDNQIFALSLVRFCDKNHIPCYHFVGTAGSDSGSSLKQKLMGLLYRRNLKAFHGHRVFAKTASVQKQLCKLGVSGVEVAHVGLDTAVIPEIGEEREEIRRALGISQDERLILFVGRIDGYKRPFELVELAKMLPEACRFIAIGSGSLDGEFEKAIEAAGKIHWIRKIANTQIHRYYKAADYFVNFNQKEIFGMSILEAMYQGCTVIANHAPGPDEIIADGVSGYLVDSTEQMMTLIQNQARLDSGHVRSYLLSHFTWEQTAKHIQLWMQQEIVEK